MNELFNECKEFTQKTDRGFSLQYWSDKSFVITLGTKKEGIDTYTFYVNVAENVIEFENETCPDNICIEDMKDIAEFFEILNKYKTELLK